MATVTFRLANYVRKKDGKQQVQMWIYAKNTEKPEDTGIKITSKQWDSKRMRVRSNHPNYIVFNQELDRMEQKVARSTMAIRKSGGLPTAQRVASISFATTDFHAYLEEIAADMTGETQYYNKRSLGSLQRALKEFSPVLSLEEIDADLLVEFENALRKRPGRTGGLADSTINKRMSQLRTAYGAHPNRAHPSPFEDYKVPSSEKEEDPEPLTELEIDKLWNGVPRTRMESEGKDIFLFSFYAAGMRPGDVVSLLWSEVKETEIVYLENKKEHRKKKSYVHIDLNPRLVELLARRPKDKRTVFGILKSDGAKDLRREIDSCLSGRRNEFKLFCAQVAGISKYVTFRTARTTFAHMGEEKVGLDQTRQAMNHSSVNTTKMYAGRNIETARKVQAAVYSSVPEPASQAVKEPVAKTPTLEIRRYNSNTD